MAPVLKLHETTWLRSPPTLRQYRHQALSHPLCGAHSGPTRGKPFIHQPFKCHRLLNFSTWAVFLLYNVCDTQTCMRSLSLHYSHPPAWLPRTGAPWGLGQGLLHLCVTSVWDRTQLTAVLRESQLKGKINFRGELHFYCFHQAERS